MIFIHKALLDPELLTGYAKLSPLPYLTNSE